jgi:hypothetical protein
LASRVVPLVLAIYFKQEEEKEEDYLGNHPVNSPNDSREQTLGCRKNSWGALEIGHYFRQTDHSEIYPLVE